MISRKLIRTDLNLLVALQILLEERNVTRAAERLSVSQPALSKTLQKLRDSFEDELFTRTSHGLIPTPRAEELGRELPGLLETIEQVLGDADFSPDTYAGCFKLLMPPILCESLLPSLMAELADIAPNVQIIMAEVPPNYQEQLKKGEADFAALRKHGITDLGVAEIVSMAMLESGMARHAVGVAQFENGDQWPRENLPSKTYAENVNA